MNRTLLALPLLLAAVAAQANLIQNGAFTGVGGAPSVEGWSTLGEVEPNNYQGPNCVRGGTFNGVDSQIVQSLPLEPGTVYRLTFDALSNQGTGASNGIEARLGSSLLFSNDGDLPWDWTSFETTFTASSSRDLWFTLRDHSSTVSLTNVSVQAVPEPASLAIFLAGTSAHLVRRRSRSNMVRTVGL